MNSPSSHDTALVLGGGGSTGNAWLIGVIAGLGDAGLDVSTADLTVGTSAGATAAAQLAGATVPELFAATTVSPPLQRPDASGRGIRNKPVVDHLERMTNLIAASSGAADMRRRIGEAALERDIESDGFWSMQWRDTVASRLPGSTWPDREMRITAINARTGEPVVFDRRGGADLVDAVAASTSSGLPYRIGDELYLDGGFRRGAENADLATGYARVLVLSPFSGAALTPIEWGMHLSTQVEDLRATGSAVEVIFPPVGSEHMFGTNAMNMALRPVAAHAGYDQGRVLAESLSEFWLLES